ncbi:MAG: glyoxalase/bleomycin resistance/extradiol dioxygenase family protein [Bacteroidetes bacterium]|jgi:predicted lactoylglutathione lyase|nr:glyoxalase/bleomycin resistance/extradiol dioxygenase family protein [Bacteroidota bacterium]
MTQIKSIYVNLPVKDLERSRKFWSGLGFGFNEQFSDEKALCLVLSEGTIYSMLILPEFFATFTNKPIADGSSTQVLMAIEVDSRQKVDELMGLALAHGASRYRDGADHGWMYYDSFADPDGHQWEVMWMDMAQLPKE